MLQIAHWHHYSAETPEEKLQHNTKAALEAAFSCNWKQKVIVSNRNGFGIDFHSLKNDRLCYPQKRLLAGS